MSAPAAPATVVLAARVWRRFLVLAGARLLEYRVGFLLSLLDSTAQLGLLVVTTLVYYRFAAEVAGWSRADALVLLGVYWVFDGLWSFQLAENLAGLSRLIRRGELDFVLLRPLPAPFLVACWRGVDLRQGVKVLQGVLLIVYAGQAAGVVWGALGVLGACAFGLCGLTLLYALRFAIATGTFWVMQTDDLYELFYSFFEAARFPVTYFQEPVRSLLTYVIPVAFAATFPAQALLGRADYRLLPAGLLLSVVAVLASNRFWRYAVRAYCSAGG